MYSAPCRALMLSALLACSLSAAASGAGTRPPPPMPAGEMTAPAFDAAPQVAQYASLVHQSYVAAAKAAQQMQRSIQTLLDAPSERSLAAARVAWIAARPHYLVTEAFRFYGGPIDVDPHSGEPGPESHLNAWPINEAFIDAVRGQPHSGLINDTRIPLTPAIIRARDQVSDEADVTTGWHAIEFLLWGQDFNPDGPGNRSHADYVAGSAATDRRRLYLRVITGMLVEDLRQLASEWAPGANNYRRQFLALDPREALGLALNGIANLAAHEMASERLSVALDSGDQEDEQSCFSDTTHQDHRYDLHGVRNVWLGSLDGVPSARGLHALVWQLDPVLAVDVDSAYARAQSAINALEVPFEAVLRAAPGSPPRQRAEAAVKALLELGRQLGRVGQQLGVTVVVPGLGEAS